MSQFADACPAPPEAAALPQADIAPDCRQQANKDIATKNRSDQDRRLTPSDSEALGQNSVSVKETKSVRQAARPACPTTAGGDGQAGLPDSQAGTKKTSEGNSSLPDCPRQAGQAGSPYSKEFLKFWEAYPIKVGKFYCWKIWNKISKHRPPTDTILSAIEAQKEHKKMLKTTGQFCPEWPHPSTWLNQGRWEDEVTRDYEIENLSAGQAGWSPAFIKITRQ